MKSKECQEKDRGQGKYRKVKTKIGEDKKYKVRKEVLRKLQEIGRETMSGKGQMLRKIQESEKANVYGKVYVKGKKKKKIYNEYQEKNIGKW